MFVQFGAKVTAVHSVVREFYRKWQRLVRALTLLAIGGSVSGCAAPVTLSGRDPADPQAKVAAVGYRSTVAPYTSLRPTVPSSWRQLNDSVAPSPKSGH